MDDGSAVILSVAKYYSPNGKAIQDTGVTPGTLQADADASATTDDDDDADTAPTAQKPNPVPGADPVMLKTYEIIKK
jgi:carboxyl-terminal processing protease